MANVHDVAAALLQLAGPLDHLKLQKLLYYVQGWSTAWRSTPMFDAPVEAWRYGPVVDEVYQTYKHCGRNLISQPEAGDPARLSDDERNTLRAVLDRYAVLESTTLGSLTHEDDAWIDAWEKRKTATRGRRVIPPSDIARSLRRASAFGHPNQPTTVDADQALVDQAWRGDGDALAKLFALAGGQIQGE